jgi:hypothetical protein
VSSAMLLQFATHSEKLQKTPIKKTTSKKEKIKQHHSKKKQRKNPK